MRPRVTYTATAPATARDSGWLCGSDMTHLTAMPASHALDRITDWRIALRAENKSPGTILIYAVGATRYLSWCADGDHVRVEPHLCAGCGEIAADPFPGVKAPRYEPPLVEPLTDAELRALLATCAVSDDHARLEATLNDRRDEAIIRLMFETAIRSGELVDLQLDDVDLIARLITIRRGKGGRGRVIPVGPVTTEALLVYLDQREQHPLAASPDLWLGNRGQRFGREGLSRALRRRAKRAGVQGFRPHRLRHTAAHRWLAAGGSESGLRAIAGWTRSDMLVRYTRARASERAATEARRLNLGDL